MRPHSPNYDDDEGPTSPGAPFDVNQRLCVLFWLTLPSNVESRALFNCIKSNPTVSAG